MKIEHIYYVAGFLEGEGYFGRNDTTPRIHVGTRDRDVMRKLKYIMAPDVTLHTKKDKRSENNSDIYYFNVMGCRAIQWMMTLYPLMGERRKSQIESVIAKWKTTKKHVNKLRVVA